MLHAAGADLKLRSAKLGRKLLLLLILLLLLRLLRKALESLLLRMNLQAPDNRQPQ